MIKFEHGRTYTIADPTNLAHGTVKFQVVVIKRHGVVLRLRGGFEIYRSRLLCSTFTNNYEEVVECVHIRGCTMTALDYEGYKYKKPSVWSHIKNYLEYHLITGRIYEITHPN